MTFKPINQLKKEIKKNEIEIDNCESCQMVKKLLIMCRCHEAEAMSLQAQLQILKDVLKLINNDLETVKIWHKIKKHKTEFYKGVIKELESLKRKIKGDSLRGEGK